MISSQHNKKKDRPVFAKINIVKASIAINDIILIYCAALVVLGPDLGFTGADPKGKEQKKKAFSSGIM